MATDGDIERVAQKAADLAAQHMASRSPTMQQIEELVDKVATRVSREASQEAAKNAVVQTLIGFGLDPTNRNEIIKDMIFLSELRSLISASKKHAIMAIIGLMATGVCAATFAYMKAGGKLP